MKLGSRRKVVIGIEMGVLGATRSWVGEGEAAKAHLSCESPVEGLEVNLSHMAGVTLGIEHDEIVEGIVFDDDLTVMALELFDFSQREHKNSSFGALMECSARVTTSLERSNPPPEDWATLAPSRRGRSSIALLRLMLGQRYNLLLWLVGNVISTMDAVDESGRHTGPPKRRPSGPEPASPSRHLRTSSKVSLKWTTPSNDSGSAKPLLND